MAETKAVPERHPDHFATRAEVAAYLRVAPRTLDQWAYQGIGPRFTKVGRARYRWSDVEAWIAAQETGGGAAAS
jgi:hypothetical protein